MYQRLIAFSNPKTPPNIEKLAIGIHLDESSQTVGIIFVVRIGIKSANPTRLSFMGLQFVPTCVNDPDMFPEQIAEHLSHLFFEDTQVESVRPSRPGKPF